MLLVLNDVTWSWGMEMNCFTVNWAFTNLSFSVLIATQWFTFQSQKHLYILGIQVDNEITHTKKEEH